MKLLQGVREIFELIDAPAGADISSTEGKIILIGRGVKDIDFESDFRKVLN